MRDIAKNSMKLWSPYR